MILIFVLYALYAAFFFINKILAACAPPLLIIGARFFIAGLLLLGYYFFTGGRRVTLSARDWLWYLQMSLLSAFGSGILLIWAIKHISATKACFIYTFGPFVTYLYSYVLFQEKMSVKKWLGLFVGFFGMLPILLLNPSSEEITGGLFFKFLSLPEIATFLGVALFSYGWIGVQRFVRHRQQAPTFINGLNMVIAGSVGIACSLLLEQPITIADHWAFWGWLALVIVCSNIIIYNLYAALLRTYTATFLSFASFLSLLFSALYGWLFFHERITWHFFLTTILLFSGLYIFYQEDFKKTGMTR